MDEVIERAQQLLEELQQKVQDLCDKINWILGKIPWGLGWVGDKIRDGWDKLMGKLDEFWGEVNDKLGNPGSPSALSNAADDWNTRVGGPVSSQAGVVDAGQLMADDRWSGSAADSYRQAVTPQKTAMEKIKTSLVTGMVQALDKMQTSIIIFWTAFAAGIAACIAGFIGAIASTATILGAPAGPIIAVGAVLVLIAALGGGMLKLSADIRSSKTIITGALADLGAYPGGSWPKAVGL